MASRFPLVTVNDVLPGYTAFTKLDIKLGAERLRNQGYTARGKKALATSGDDQHVFRSPNNLQNALDNLSDAELKRYGYVVEANLKPQTVRTLIVGQIMVNGITVSYVGEQKTIADTRDVLHQGGTVIHYCRGDFPELLKYARRDKNMRLAIKQAQHFDRLAQDILPMFGSRRSYDVVQGETEDGVFRSGVTDQTWRVGGPSGTEVLVLQALKQDPTLTRVNGSSHIVYYDPIRPRNSFNSTNRYNFTDEYSTQTPPEITQAIPEGAVIFFNGEDDRLNPKKSLLMFSTVKPIRPSKGNY
jgi:hypothetical protein